METQRRALLLSGIAGGSVSLRPLRTYLRNNGIRADDWRNPIVRFRRVRDASSELVDDILALGREADDLTLIGYSMGGLIALDAMRDRRVAAVVGTVITLCSPIHGASVAGLPALFGLRRTYLADLAPGSPLLAAIRGQIEDTRRNWRYLQVLGRHDLIVEGGSTSAYPTVVVPYGHIGTIRSHDVHKRIAQFILKPTV